MRLWKMNGAGNAFAVYDAREQYFDPTVRHLRSTAKKMKVDQIMAIQADLRANAFLRIWNADGSEVKACGNGTRAVAHLLLSEIDEDQVLIRTDAGLLKGYRAEDGLVAIDMGSPLTGWEDIPLSAKMEVDDVDLGFDTGAIQHLPNPSVVSMGNPHAVFFVENLDDCDVETFGPMVENHTLFPEGTNVGFAQIIDRKTIRLRVWERGVGLTKACGTGACAALVCAARTGRTEDKAKLILDGGDLYIEWPEDTGRVMMTGPVELEDTLDV